MEKKEIKFKVTCYFTGYGSWSIDVYDGEWLTGITGIVYTINVKFGKYGSEEIYNKKFMFPINSTVIEVNV